MAKEAKEDALRELTLKRQTGIEQEPNSDQKTAQRTDSQAQRPLRQQPKAIDEQQPKQRAWKHQTDLDRSEVHRRLDQLQVVLELLEINGLQ